MKHEFKLPVRSVRARYLKLTPAIGVGLALSIALQPSMSLRSLTFAILVVGLTIAATYVNTISHVWVSLDRDGVHGRGKTGRTIDIWWAEPVSLERKRQSGFSGIEIRTAASSDSIRRHLESLFVPNAILSMEAFDAAIRELSPADHPLRRLQEIET